MKIGKIAAIYSILLGIAMLGMWTVFLATGQVPEIQIKFYEIALHIAGEVATALALIVGGYGLLTAKKWGFQAYMFSMGMLLYTLIVSPGYYIQRGEVVMTGMFAVFFVLALVFIVLSFARKGDYQPEN
ncbi:hypothetical protein [Methanocella sp. MCL-LM]|uniref:hypothetical protein n=1 Tax=Methanocella sp. MCL-LM TaxID=3412035 RepID=UPI003C72756A